MKLPKGKRKNLVKIIKMFRKSEDSWKQFLYPIIKTYIDELKNQGYKIKKYFRYLK